MANVTILTYGKCYLGKSNYGKRKYGKRNYGKCMMAIENETKPCMSKTV